MPFLRRAVPVVLALGLLLLRPPVSLYAGSRFEPALHVARHHPMRYYLTLPDGWTRTRKWPVLVTLEGSGRDYAGNHLSFVSARGDKPYIVVTPVIASNVGRNRAPEMYDAAVAADVRRLGSTRFDYEGLEAVLADVQRDFGGEPRVYLTGFSAGGHLTWLAILARPDWLAAAAPAATNYIGRGMRGAPTPGPGERGPIHVFQGDRDPRYETLSGQIAEATKLARAAGYTDIARTVVPGAGHGRFVRETFAFLDSVRVAREAKAKSTAPAPRRPKLRAPHPS